MNDFMNYVINKNKNIVGLVMINDLREPLKLLCMN